jgi:hypothetical protein
MSEGEIKVLRFPMTDLKIFHTLDAAELPTSRPLVRLHLVAGGTGHGYCRGY